MNPNQNPNREDMHTISYEGDNALHSTACNGDPLPNDARENRFYGLKGFSEIFSRKLFFFVLLALIAFLIMIFEKQVIYYASCFLGSLSLFALLRGQMRTLTNKYKWKKGLAAGLLTLEAVFFFIIPLGGIVGMLVDLLSKTNIDINAIYEQLRTWNGMIVDRFNVDLLSVNTLKDLSGLGQRLASALIASGSSLMINSILMIFTLFYMLYQREALESAIRELLPFSNKNKQIVISESKRIIVANAIAIPVLAIIQGLFAYIGYLILGVPSALFYGVLTAFATVIPIVGTMIVWVPIAIWFATTGHWVMAIVMALYGLLIIGGVDNVARFILQKKLADIHPLITVFGVIFGMSIFGFWGVIFGPLLISLLILFLNMYRHDYVHGSKAQPRVTEAVKEKKSAEKLEQIIRSHTASKEDKR